MDQTNTEFVELLKFAVKDLAVFLKKNPAHVGAFDVKTMTICQTFDLEVARSAALDKLDANDLKVLGYIRDKYEVVDVLSKSMTDVLHEASISIIKAEPDLVRKNQVWEKHYVLPSTFNDIVTVESNVVAGECYRLKFLVKRDERISNRFSTYTATILIYKA